MDILIFLNFVECHIWMLHVQAHKCMGNVAHSKSNHEENIFLIWNDLKGFIAIGNFIIPEGQFVIQPAVFQLEIHTRTENQINFKCNFKMATKTREMWRKMENYY